ncbi:MAG: hypothetical protein IT435_07975 [Phycisphaerales bacterium]|nr:hypothetical protein [Phycisphaerales bacterium]
MTFPTSPTPPGPPTPSGRRKVDPIELLLGSPAAAGGPWALLGLEPGALSDRDVTLALERQLAHVNRHPLGGTPEADDVRLALHTAAAQILHPEVRNRLLAAQTPGSTHANPAVTTAPVFNSATTPPGSHARTPSAAHDPMLRIIAMHGGLNGRSLRDIMRLAGAAHASPRALAAQLHDRLIAWSHQRHATPGRPIPVSPAHAWAAPLPASRASTMPGFDSISAPPGLREDDDPDPGVRALKIIVVSALAVIAAAAVILIGISLLLNKSGSGGSWLSNSDTPAHSPQNTPRQLFPAADTPPTAKTDGKDADPAAAPAADDPVALVRELAAAAADVPAQPESAAERFNTAVRALATRWRLLAPDQLGAAQDAIVEFLYRAPGTQIPDEALQTVFEPSISSGTPAWKAPRVWTEVWQAGLKTRLSRERDLPAAVRNQIDQMLAPSERSSPTDAGTFTRGALARLAGIPADMLQINATGATKPPPPPPPSPAEAQAVAEAWTAWREAARQVAASDDAAFDHLALSALEILLSEGPEPLADYGLADTARELTLAISWRKNSPARTWLIASFSSDTLTNLDLHLVTQALAGHSSAEGVDSKMVLAAIADEKSRLELREAYATAWGMGDPARKDELLALWRQKATAAQEATVQPDPEDEHRLAALVSAVTRAELNLAATMLWAGLIEEPATIIQDPAAITSAILGQSAGAATPRRIDEGGTDGAWAVQYLTAEQRVPDRLKLLTDLLRANRPLGQLDAQIVVTEATRGSPETVRAAARDAVERASASPAVVYALLQESYRIPRTRQNAHLLSIITNSRLPSLKDPQWYAGVRRVLVDTLIQVLASRGPERTIDRLAEELGHTCAGRAKPSSTATSSPANSPNAAATRNAPLPTPLDSIKDLLNQWRKNADTLLPTGREPITLEQIDRRLASRLAMAQGPVQEFQARHTAVAELMAYIISIEQPAESDQARQILDQLTTARRAAVHIMDQIDATELAMLKLWGIRLQSVPSAPAGQPAEGTQS